jgi:hypothetical protein
MQGSSAARPARGGAAVVASAVSARTKDELAAHDPALVRPAGAVSRRLITNVSVGAVAHADLNLKRRSSW